MSKYYSSSIAFGAKQTKTEKVVVSPTKIGDVTTDAVSGALTVDEVPVLNSLNPVSSDGVARAVIQAGAELPTRSSEDTGKVLTVKNSDGDLEWSTVSGGESNVTTADKEFTVGVNGTGLPITVDCSRAAPVGTTSSVTLDGEYLEVTSSSSLYPSVTFQHNLAGLQAYGGTVEFTLVVPEDVDLSAYNMVSLSDPSLYTVNSDGTRLYQLSNSSLTGLYNGSTRTICAGTYTVSVTIPTPYPGGSAVPLDGLAVPLFGGGEPTQWAAVKAAISAAAETWTLSFNDFTVQSYNYDPLVLPEFDNANVGKFLRLRGTGYVDWFSPFPSLTDNAGKVLAVNSYATGVEWVTAQGGSSDVFIVEDSTTQGDVYTAYTSGKVLFYKASSGEMYYMSSSQFSTSSQLYLFGAYVGGYGTHATVVHFDAYINLANGAPVAPTLPFSSALGNIETIQTPSPLPTYSTTTDVGKALQVTSNGLDWINSVPIEVVAALPANPTAGVLYIVTGA